MGLRGVMVGLALLLLGCEAKTVETEMGTQTGDDGLVEGGGRCVELARQRLEDPTVVTEGFVESADAGWDRASGSFEGMLTAGYVGDVPFDVMISAVGDWEVVRFDDSPASGASGSMTEPAFIDTCADVYERVVSVTLQSPALLDETLTTPLRMAVDGTADLVFELPYDDLVGAAEPEAFDPTRKDRVWLDVYGGLAAGDRSWSGGVAFQGESSSGSGPSGTVSVVNDMLGYFTAEQVSL